jgi:hypothetical protein
MEYLISVLVLVVLLFSYLLYNLLRKLEKYEDLVDKLTQGLNKIGETMLYSTESLRELDAKGHFEADDELGIFFTSMKEAQQTINDTFLEITLDEKKEVK